MRANPGGAIGPKDVIGRDRLIADLWRALDSQSVVLTSERRIGKSTVIQKMQRESSERSTSPYCVLRDLEGLRTPQEFVDSVYSDIEGRLSRTERARTKFWGLRSKLGGTQIGDRKSTRLNSSHLGISYAVCSLK